MRRLATALLLSLALSAPVHAEPSGSHRAAAAAMLEEVGMQRVLTDAIDLAMRAQIEANPMLQPYEGVMREFLGRYMSWEALREPLIQMYAEAFTEKELKQITKFYRTPAGKKSAQITPELMARGSALGQQQVLAHQGELMEMIQRRAIELGQDAGAPAQ